MWVDEYCLHPDVVTLRHPHMLQMLKVPANFAVRQTVGYALIDNYHYSSSWYVNL